MLWSPTVLALDSRHKGTDAPSFVNPVVDERRMRPGRSALDEISSLLWRMTGNPCHLSAVWGSVPEEVKDESEGNVLAGFTRETAIKTAVLLTVVVPCTATNCRC